MGKLAFLCFIVVGSMLLTAALALQSPKSDAPDVTDGNSILPTATRPSHDVLVRKPTAPAGVNTGRVDFQGNPVVLECRNCHDVMEPNINISDAAQLDKFHQRLKFTHGQLSCVACHNSQDGYTTLHLADGTTISYADTMTLCAQCHGPQHRDYQHGSHGGMTGYWDLTKGPRQRNHCVDCHDPHSPQIPVVRPAAGPNDRFSPLHRDSEH